HFFQERCGAPDEWVACPGHHEFGDTASRRHPAQDVKGGDLIGWRRRVAGKVNAGSFASIVTLADTVDVVRQGNVEIRHVLLAEPSTYVYPSRVCEQPVGDSFEVGNGVCRYRNWPVSELPAKPPTGRRRPINR